MTKSELKKELSSRYPIPFIEMLDQCGIVKELKTSIDEGCILARPAMLADVDKQFPLYEELYRKLLEISYMWR